jgi:hypothetical protein
MPENHGLDSQTPDSQDMRMKITRKAPTPPPNLSLTINLPYSEDNAVDVRRAMQAIMNALDGRY